MKFYRSSIFFMLAISSCCISSGMERRRTHWGAAQTTLTMLRHMFPGEVKQYGISFPDGRAYQTTSGSHIDTPNEDFATVAFLGGAEDASKFRRALSKHRRKFGSIDNPAPFLIDREDGRPILATLAQLAAIAGNWDALHGLAAEGANMNAVTHDLPETPLQLLQIQAVNAAREWGVDETALLSEIEATWTRNIESGQGMISRVADRHQLTRERAQESRQSCQTKLLLATLIFILVIWNMTPSGS